MDELDRLLVERSCERLINEYSRLVDFAEAAAVADLFTEDARWQGTDLLLEGMAGRIRPTLAWERCPVLPSMLRQGTADEPMKGLIEMAKRAEAEARARVTAQRQGHEPLADRGERHPAGPAAQRGDADRGHRRGRLARAEQLLHRQAERLGEAQRYPQ